VECGGRRRNEEYPFLLAVSPSRFRGSRSKHSINTAWRRGRSCSDCPFCLGSCRGAHNRRGFIRHACSPWRCHSSHSRTAWFMCGIHYGFACFYLAARRSGWRGWQHRLGRVRWQRRISSRSCGGRRRSRRGVTRGSLRGRCRCDRRGRARSGCRRYGTAAAAPTAGASTEVRGCRRGGVDTAARAQRSGRGDAR